MKKRTLLAFFCAAVLSAGLLAGCGNAKEETKTETGSSAENENTDNSKGMTASDAAKADDVVDEKEAEAAGFTDGSEENGTDAEDDGTGDKNTADTDKKTAEDTETDTKEIVLDTEKPLSGIHHAEITIKDYGTIDVELDADTAPVTVTNFVKLAQEDFYDGLTFHRIMDGFMMQGGDPLGNGKGGADENIKGEFSNNGVENNISHTRGTISMARGTDPDSASSQFFIVQTDSILLDGDYAAFGHVTEGMDIVDQICKEAKPTDNNGSIKTNEQPEIESVKIVG